MALLEIHTKPRKTRNETKANKVEQSRCNDHIQENAEQDTTANWINTLSLFWHIRLNHIIMHKENYNFQRQNYD